MGIFDAFRPKKVQAKKSLNANTIVQQPITGLLTPLSINYKQDNAYHTMSAVYTVVSFLMQKFSAVPIKVYKVEDTVALKSYKLARQQQYSSPAKFIKARKLQHKALGQVDEDSELSALLQQPNPIMSGDLFFSTLFGFKLLKGEGFIWANRGMGQEGNLNAPPLELYTLPPQYMHLVPDRDNIYGIKQWVIQLPALRPLPVEDILLWRYPRFDFDSTTHIHLRGQSPLTAGKNELDGVSALDEAYKATYQNRGANGVLMAKEGDITPEQVGKIITQINERINGSQNSGSIAGGAGVWDFFDLSMSAKDMALIEAKKFSLTQVANLYNVPAGIWDMSESANNNITQYRSQVYTDKIMGEWASLLNQLNSWLLPSFGMRGYYIDADYTDLPDLQADMQRMFDRYKDEWRITPNEWREIAGWDRIEDENMDKVWVKSGLKPIEDASINIDDYDMGGTTDTNSQGRI